MTKLGESAANKRIKRERRPFQTERQEKKGDCVPVFSISPTISDMRKPEPDNQKRELGVIQATIDDANLLSHSRSMRAQAQEMGLENYCRRLAEHGLGAQSAWKIVRLRFERPSYRTFLTTFHAARRAAERAELIEATVMKTGVDGAALPPGGWPVVTAEGRRLRAFVIGRFRTLNTPRLQVGDVVYVRPHPSDEERCSIDLQQSPVKWKRRQS